MLEIQNEFLFTQKNKQALESLLDHAFLIRLLKFIYKTRHIKGDIIELGAFEGGTSVILAHFLKKNEVDKLLFSCDTFEGHPYDDKHGTDIRDKIR